jgi:cytochrome c biogenesis protein CcmG/thiol:disulfide interchange protein DsbE
MRLLRVLSVAGVLALLGLLVWQVAHRHGPGVAQKVDKGRIVAAPKLDLPRLDVSGRLDLASLRGKVVVVNFWQSSCLPCKQEARTVVAAARSYRDKGVVFLGVDALDTKGAARAYMKRYGIDYPNVRDAVATQYPDWGVTGVPETFFIDRHGRVVPPHIVGPATPATLDEGIKRALRQ